MRLVATAIGGLGFVACLAAEPASAQSTGADPTHPSLHVSDAHGSCFFDLHPDLTSAEFKEFAAEIGSILRFRQLGGPSTLGKGRVDISLQYSHSPIDDTKGAWNNTMSHPTAEHYLGRAVAIPRVAARVGVSDRVDIGAWGGIAPDANYGFVGADTKVALMTEGPRWPVSLAIRPTLSVLFGPKELWAANTSVDISASRSLGPVTPYIGVATTASVAFERSPDVDLDPATAEGALAYAGLAYRWKSLVLAAEVERAALVSYAFRIGTRF